MANPIQTVLKRSRATWVLLAQTAVWVTAAIAGFLLPPPIGTAEETRIWVRFAQFIVTVVVGLMFLAALRWKQHEEVFRWATLSGIFLTLGTVVFFTYQIFAAHWTVPYNGQRVVVGSVYTAHGREYHAEKPDLTPGDLVEHAAGKVEKIWTRESLDERRLLLAGMYVLTTPLLTICIMATVQAMQCAVAKTSARKRPVSAAAAKRSR